jgi:hypothetical protein
LQAEAQRLSTLVKAARASGLLSSQRAPGSGI